MQRVEGGGGCSILCVAKGVSDRVGGFLCTNVCIYLSLCQTILYPKTSCEFLVVSSFVHDVFLVCVRCVLPPFLLLLVLKSYLLDLLHC
jgi:hypothetical protein